MVMELEYDCLVRRLIPATVAAFAVGLLSLFLPPMIQAQVNGVPPSVTSPGFGGHFNSAPGVPASVTSPGPNGFRPTNPFFTEPVCCINPLFPINSNPPLFPRHRHHGAFFPGAVPVYTVPSTPVIIVQPGVDDSMEEDYNGGPTIFDRRGSGQSSRLAEGRSWERGRSNPPATEPTPEPSAAATSVADQPETVLVFKDGHQVEVANYAIVGSTLYDLTEGHRHKIALSELNLDATAQLNEDRGIDFQLPAGPEKN
jgi:hypothetical protein